MADKKEPSESPVQNHQTDKPASPQVETPKKKTRKLRWLIIPILFVFLVGAGIFAYLKLFKATPEVVLSTSEQELVNAIGYPDTFTIYYDYSSNKDTPIKLETWNYYNLNSSYNFKDGAYQFADHSLKDSVKGWIFPETRPDQFGKDLTKEKLDAIAGEQPNFSATINPEILGENITGNVYDYQGKFIAVIKNGGVVYIQTLPLNKL